MVPALLVSPHFLLHRHRSLFAAVVSRTMALDSRYLKPFQEPAESPPPASEYPRAEDETTAHVGVWKHPVPMTQTEGEEYFKEFVHNKVNEDRPTGSQSTLLGSSKNPK